MYSKFYKENIQGILYRVHKLKTSSSNTLKFSAYTKPYNFMTFE